MCGFMGLTFLFRGLVRLWRHLDLNMLKRVFDSDHGRRDELVAFSHDPAVLGSRLVPNTMCVSQENWFQSHSQIFAHHR